MHSKLFMFPAEVKYVYLAEIRKNYWIVFLKKINNKKSR